MFTETSFAAQSEFRFAGLAGFSQNPLCVGKIYIWEENSSPPEAPIICIFNPQNAASASSYMSLTPPSAVILSSSATSAKLLTFLICAKIPYFILKESTDAERICNGSVALLDTKENLLITSPSIETINSYSFASNPCKTTQKELFSYDISTHTIRELHGKRILIDAVGISSEELFDSLVNLAEASYAPPMCVMLNVPKSDAECEYFEESIESVFRAAVYGIISLMLKGYSSKSQMENASKCISRVFSSLQDEGREFNGYIKKGLLVDAPIYLLQALPLHTPDFVCYDIDMLLPSLFGRNEKFNAEQKSSAFGVLEKYINGSHGNFPIWLKSQSSELAPFTKELRDATDASEIYLDL